MNENGVEVVERVVTGWYPFYTYTSRFGANEGTVGKPGTLGMDEDPRPGAWPYIWVFVLSGALTAFACWARQWPSDPAQHGCL